MSTDYRYTIRRKADDKKIAVFYYNMIKNLYDIDCIDFNLKLDPEKIRTFEDHQLTKYTVEDINSDIEKLTTQTKLLNMKIFEKKLLLPSALNVDVKTDIEADIFSLEESITNCMYAIEALAGLKSVVTTLVEDQVNIGQDDEDSIAYVYNAKGLPKTKDGYDAHLWASDVYIEAEAIF